MRSSRKNVTWTDPAAKMGVRAANLPHPHFVEVPIAPANMERLRPHLYVGALWRTTHASRPMQSDSRHVQHELAYMTEDPWGPKWPAGTLVVYTGQVRVEEGRLGDTVRVPRHTFLIGGVRYMTTNLMLFVPVV